MIDGGGVRGLSSLLILQALMVQINQTLTSLGTASGELHPHHVFQLVAGTSTGGLIALMLGKMGMTVDECITQYEELSRVIFGKKHLRGRITHGLAPARYSGKCLRNCIRKLLRDRQLDENMSMGHEADRVAWYVPAMLRILPRNIFSMATSQDEACFANTSIISAVICIEHCSSSQYSKLKSKAVLICSLPCKDNLLCKVCDAARATSAAPTFFPVISIEDRFFADGGLAHNNPSFAIYFHYTRGERKKSTRPMAASATSAPQLSPHGDLDCSRVRFTNIGTGAKADEVEPGKRDRLAGLIPGIIRKGVFLKQTLTEIAVNSEEKAVFMKQFQYLNSDLIMYERFDANHGVSNIKLDDHNALGEIREKTAQYLEEQETKDLLEEVGSAIATDYLNPGPIQGQNVQPTDLAIDKSGQPLKVSNLIPASSSLSSGPSSHSGYPESESHVLFPNHDNLQNGGLAPLTEHPAETLLPPDGQGPSKHYTHEDSGIDTTEPETSMAAAPV